MAKAIWEGTVLAESDQCVTLEGNRYFPPTSVRRQYLRANATHTTCPWKGRASYYDVVVNEKINPNAAWYYSSPSPAAREIKDHVAFWKGVVVEE